jgi:hypothetical protein
MIAHKGRLWCVLVAVGVSVCFSGCGPDNPLGRKSVSGTVTLDGAPVQQGSINFQPQQAGGVSSGAMILDGKYSIAATEGLPDGKYLVQIYGIDPSTIGQLPEGGMPGDDLPEAKEIIPAEWNVKSDKMVEVSGKGPFQFDFPITSK